MSESTIMQDIRSALSNGAVRLFRNNIGQGWMGAARQNPSTGTVVMANAHQVRFGLPSGSGDLIGWESVTITPEMVGRKLAVFVSIEVKAPKGRETTDQIAWAHAVRDAGGIAGTARSVDEARALLEITC